MSIGTTQHGYSMLFWGYLAANPEPRYTSSGKAITTFKLIFDMSYTDQQGNKVKRAQAVTFVTWNALAENCNKWLVKGQYVVVTAKIPFKNPFTGKDGTLWGDGPDAWIDQKTNQARSKWEFEAVDVQFGRKPQNGQQQQQYQNDDSAQEQPVSVDDSFDGGPPF